MSWVWCPRNHLGGSLSKMSNLTFETNPFSQIFHRIQIETVFVCQMVENVHLCYGFSSSLLVAVNQVDPASNVLIKKLRLKGFPKDSHEDVWIFLGPLRQHHIVNPFLILCQSIIVVVYVYKQFRQHIEVWNQLTYVTWGIRSICPTVLVMSKYSIGDIELPTLERHGTI